MPCAFTPVAQLGLDHLVWAELEPNRGARESRDGDYGFTRDINRQEDSHWVFGVAKPAPLQRPKAEWRHTMPFFLNFNEDISGLTDFRSVLIVPCRFCPAASAAMKNEKPYIELFRKFMKTDSYEQSIARLKSKLEDKGIQTRVFRSNLIHQFVLCMWTEKRRGKLRADASEFDCVLVLGCEGAVRTVRDSIQSSSCTILQGLETEGLFSAKPRFQLPCNISLELESVTPVVFPDGQAQDARS